MLRGFYRYGDHFQYVESMRFPGRIAAVIASIAIPVFALFAMFAPTRWLLGKVA